MRDELIIILECAKLNAIGKILLLLLLSLVNIKTDYNINKNSWKQRATANEIIYVSGLNQDKYIKYFRKIFWWWKVKSLLSS